MRFYVYRLFDDLLVTLYVGKGSGRRFAAQKRKRGCFGEILGYFKSETEAYRREKELIAELKPTENKHQGGNGSRATPKRKSKKYRWEREMEEIGTRKYSARLLLQYGLSGLDARKIDAIRQVADGPRL